MKIPRHQDRELSRSSGKNPQGAGSGSAPTQRPPETVRFPGVQLRRMGDLNPRGR
ncbi:hypothetical protein ACFFX0_14705 [Citricoccus parietis]|uniref:Uncharacterized protein n=1 Tax=Citricoccus parietis TaxID=592307 RepID=A0ABV5G137_9MICC